MARAPDSFLHLGDGFPDTPVGHHWAISVLAHPEPPSRATLCSYSRSSPALCPRYLAESTNYLPIYSRRVCLRSPLTLRRRRREVKRAYAPINDIPRIYYARPRRIDPAIASRDERYGASSHRHASFPQTRVASTSGFSVGMSGTGPQSRKL